MQRDTVAVMVRLLGKLGHIVGKFLADVVEDECAIIATSDGIFGPISII